jgi:hypothetical protein
MMESIPSAVVGRNGMQFIQELTPLQQAAASTMAAVALVLVLVALKRRRSAAEAGPDALKERRSRRRKSDKVHIPRRQRRMLAAEAAMSMGVESAPAQAESDVITGDIVVPPVPSTKQPAPVAVAAAEEAPAPVAVAAAEEAPAPPRAVVVDDPYVSELGTYSTEQSTVVEGPEAIASDRVVADPGWPAPGELSAGFDPDAFDPLPEVQEAAGYADQQPTGVIDLPSPADDAPGYGDADADFDPATGWNDSSAPGAADGSGPRGDLDHLWRDSEDDAAQWEILAEDTTPAADDNGETAAEAWGEDAADVWASPDHDGEDAAQGAVTVDGAWNEAEQLDRANEIAAGHETVPGGGGHVDAYEATAAVDEAPAFDIEAFDPADLTVQTPSFPEPMYTMNEAASEERAAVAGIALGGAGSPGPVVLDIAALAAAGRPVEVVIEPNADGSGVRLRITPPADTSAQGADLVWAPDAAESSGDPAEPDDPAEEESEAVEGFAALGDAGEPAPADVWEAVQPDFEEMQDIPFLTGGVPEPEASFDEVPEPPSGGAEPFREVHVEIDGTRNGDGSSSGDAGSGEATVVYVADPDDDPARILADIRARLATLDAQRDTHAI